jgi:NADPH:quinone reductase-like Zn-dependent oxidoreductase
VRAVVYDRYGPPEVLHLEDVPKPTPREGDVLVKIHATTVTSGDWRVRSLALPRGFGPFGRLAFGVFGPRQRILGSELAGEVEAIGKDVTSFAVGDAVFAFPGARMGSYAEYRTMPADGPIVRKPPNLTFEEAAALSFGGSTALDFFRRGRLQRGEKVLINGASGGVGTAAVQLAKHFGADVTGVCGPANLDLVKSIGADRVVDYTQEDFTRQGRTYDVILDAAGTAPFARVKRSLSAGGRLLMVLGGLGDLLRAPVASWTSGRRVVAGPAAEKPEYLRLLAELAAAGTYRPVIDRRYRLEQIVEAHAYVDTGRKRGNVVVSVEHGSAPDPTRGDGPSAPAGGGIVQSEGRRQP